MLRMKNISKKKKLSIKIIASLATLIIISLFIFVGPVSALTLGLAGFSISNPSQGEKISTTATIDIMSEERITFDKYIELHIYGPNNRICKFKAEGGIISGCNGITIQKLSGPTYDSNYEEGYSYGYGHGYGLHQGYSDGKLTYKITLDTAYFDIGKYEIQLKAQLSTYEYTSSKQDVSICKTVCTYGKCYKYCP